jgi:hypothetical protein
MTVEELIARLRELPPEAQKLPVTSWDGDYMLVRPEWVRVEAGENAEYCVKSEADGVVEDARGPHVRIG